MDDDDDEDDADDADDFAKAIKAERDGTTGRKADASRNPAAAERRLTLTG